MPGPCCYPLLHRDSKGQQPQISRQCGFQSYCSCAAVRKQPLDGRTPHRSIYPDPLVPHGRFCGCEMLFCSFSSSFTLLAGEFVPCPCTERFDSVSFSCAVDTSHRKPAAKSHSSSCMGLFMFTIMTECKEG